ncbi:MAG: formylglycine-generating enzyme family protein [Sedimentisphaerales bacterium]|nr:formylglycine-generating enzyme family protein [Sedimentisphaerales bacterium]
MMKTSVVIKTISVGLFALAAFCTCASAACPPADLDGDYFVDFNDFAILAATRGRLLDIHSLAGQWLKFDPEPSTLLGRVEMQTDDPNEPNQFAVELVVVGRQRIGRAIFQYECQVILTNLSPVSFENAHLVMTAWPGNMTIIDPHVTFGEAEIAPGESTASMDTCTFTVDRSILIDPLEIVWRYVTASQDMTFIPGGTFQMGDNLGDGWSHELPVHTVSLDSFYMGRCEVTNRQYCDFLNSALRQGLITVTSGVVYKAGSGTSYPYCDTATSSSYSQIAYGGGVFSVRTKNGRDMSNDPMVMVSWYGSVAYCNWRSQQEGKEQCYNVSTWNCDFSKHGYRLATEAEWEYAARGGLSGRRFPWGDTITHSQANYYSYSYYSYDISPTRGFHPVWYDDVDPYTSPVGSFPVTGYGLYDMAGNVWEWCNDWYLNTYYSSSPYYNPTGPITGTSRVIRGGNWSGLASYCRVAYRSGNCFPASRFSIIGFRLVLDFQ